MNDNQREEILKGWIRPSSDDEAAQQERALRMVREALDSSADLQGVSFKPYAKGSYANSTNVRSDSDVDIAVDCTECMYCESAPGVTLTVKKPAYVGPWTGLTWRDAVEKALLAKFGSQIDTSGSTAIFIPSVPGSRPSIDVVAGYSYRRYRDSAGTSWHDGSKVFKRGGQTLINWPRQQLDNGRQKNTDTGGRYKKFVRALKSAENRMVDLGQLSEKPSFLMEVLVYNVANNTLTGSTLAADFRSTLLELWNGLGDSGTYKNWVEPSRLKWAFRDSQKWTVQDARDVVKGAWNLLGYS